MRKNTYRSLLCVLLSVAMIIIFSTANVEDPNIKDELDQGQEQPQENSLGGRDFFALSGDESDRRLNELYYGSKDGINEEFLQNFYNFMESTSIQVFRDSDGDNLLYAPFNWYLALSMLADISQEDAREEIHGVLGISDATWNAPQVNSAIHALERRRTHYYKLRINTSLWLDDEINYQEELLDKLQNQYRSELYYGDLMNPEFQDEMSKWVYKNTGFGFQPNYSNMSDNADPCAFVSLSTIHFHNEWIFPFEEEDTTRELFTINDNKEIHCDFMKMEKVYYPFMIGEDYVSTVCTLKDNESMLFILPEEGMPIADFIETQGKLSSIITNWTNNQYTMGKVKISVPKFAYESDINLLTVAESMGIKKIFDSKSQAFSGFSNENLYIGKITQESKINIDEKGCSASSFTDIRAFSSGVSKDEVEIKLNRPFIYVLYKNKIPFLVGVVQNPQA